jgi:hypothetical protein
MVKTSKLNYPAVDTWFIGWDNNRTEIKAYSMVATTQCMISPWNEMDYYTNEAEWLEVLLENGINPNEQD